MDDDHVQAKVYDEEPEEEARGGRRISLGPIIGIVVLIILFSIIGVYIFYNPGPNSIEIINPVNKDTDGDGTYDSVEFTVLATAMGPWRVNGEGTLNILQEGAKTYTGKYEVKTDRREITVPYDEFVMKNGIYNFFFEMDGVSNNNTFIVNFVPEDVNLTLSEEYDSGKWVYRAKVFPIFKGSNPTDFKGTRPTDITKFNKAYDLRFSIIGPEGYSSEETRPMADYDPDSYLITRDISSNYQGFHDVSIRFVNNLVKSESEYRSFNPPAVSAYLNRPPAIESVSYPTTVRAGEKATFTVVASDPDLNGEVEELYVLWDLNDPEAGANDTVPVTGSTTRIDHTFNDPGTYSVYITVMDNGPFYSREENYRKANDTVEEITVRSGIFG
mgnify:CR=1 FL=1